MDPLTHLINTLSEQALSLLYIDNPLTINYLTGFLSNPHERVLALLITEQHTALIVPKMEENEAKENKVIDTVLGYKDEESPWEKIQNHLSGLQLNHASIGIESDYLIMDRYNQLKQLFPDATFESITSRIQNLKVTKTEGELEQMREAGRFADIALKVGFNALKTGIAEEEVVALIEYEMKKLGIKEMSFDTMVLFGDHAASPHGTPGKRTLQPNELVLFDLGVVYNGYTSDVSRTVAYGEVSSKIKDLYEVVLQAQKTAQAAVKPEMTTGSIDSIARDIISQAGYGDYFIHRLGHGLGQSVHEYPDIAPGTRLSIKKGMCFSIEPGIYIEGLAGIRIEDCVVVTDSGSEPFTETTKELIVVPVK
ncbi:MAG: aminopeptidase P family protein [Alkalibacterium sp.]|nr:aminopeptidase P family protein [Alkalibacterium sp.]